MEEAVRQRDADLFRRFDEICAKRGVAPQGGPDDVYAGSEVHQVADLNGRGCASSRVELGPSSSGCGGDFDFPVAAASGGGGGAVEGEQRGPNDCDRSGNVSEEERWFQEWRTLRTEELQLQRLCREEVLSTDLLEAQTRPSPQLRRTLEPVFAIPFDRSKLEAETERWEEQFFQDISLMRKRLIAFVQNARPDASDSVLRLRKPLGQRLAIDLEAFRARCSEDMESCLEAEVGERLFSRFEELEASYDACLSAPSAALRPPSPDGGGGTSPEAELAGQAKPREDPEIAAIRSELDENLMAMADTQKDLAMFPDGQVQVVRRALRLFKLRLSDAFFKRIAGQLPQVSPQLLCELASLLASEENLKARKRLLLSRWRRRREELLAAGTEIEPATFDQTFDETIGAFTASTRTSSPAASPDLRCRRSGGGEGGGEGRRGEEEDENDASAARHGRAGTGDFPDEGRIPPEEGGWEQEPGEEQRQAEEEVDEQTARQDQNTGSAATTPSLAARSLKTSTNSKAKSKQQMRALRRQETVQQIAEWRQKKSAEEQRQEELRRKEKAEQELRAEKRRKKRQRWQHDVLRNYKDACSISPDKSSSTT